MLPLMPAQGARLRLALSLLVIALVAVALVGVEGMRVALILAPALLLALPLLFKRYVGERVIHRLSRRPTAVGTGRSVARARAPRLLGARLPALAVPGSGRAPPALALV
jgi:hypothetical protein